MTLLDLRRVAASREALGRLSAAVARRFGVLPLVLENNRLRLAVLDAEDTLLLDQIENLTGLTIEAVQVADAGELAKAVQRYYPETTETGAGASALLVETLHRAFQARASDIHIDPVEKGGIIRLRVDGRLRLDRELDTAAVSELVTAIKVLARLDIAEKREPLDGSIATTLGGTEMTLRVATLPTLYGERITLRLLSRDQVEGLEGLSDLGMNPGHLEIFKEALAMPHGILILTGPTGSGKTTTLYASLRHLRTRGDRHILSIEDPVEMPLPGVTQVRVDADKDRLSFARALRSALRHDPDIMMIGEIRDAETADIAVKAALTGHLVLATLHANSAVGAIPRLLDLGISPFLLGATLRLSMAQRLVRRPCLHCRTQVAPDATTRTRFGWKAEADIKIPKTVGCAYCQQTGYAGRIGLYEMLPVNETVRRLIMERREEGEFLNTVFGPGGLPTLRADGAEKILAGMTTVDEVQVVTAG